MEVESISHNWRHKSQDTPLHSIHRRYKDKTLWYKSAWETMEMTSMPTNAEKISYKSSIFPWHGIHRAILSTKLPNIKVKDDIDDVEISWCNNIFINMIKNFSVSFNDTVLQEGNTKYLFVQKHKLATDVRQTGKWGTHLDENNISLRVPFFYDGCHTNSFPLSLCGKSDRFIHKFEYALMIEDLLLMRRNGELIQFDKSLIEVDNSLISIPVPELEGLYTLYEGETITEDVEFVVENNYFVEDDNERAGGKRIQLKFGERIEYPIEKIVWGAENTNQSSIYKSLIVDNGTQSPIKNTKLETKLETIIDTEPSYKTEFSRIEDKDSVTVGINRWFNGIGHNTRKYSPGIVFKGGNITVNSRNDDNNYLLFVILFYSKKYVFKTYPKTQSERLIKGSTIELLN